MRKFALITTFRPEWQSLSQFAVPDWYKDAKSGIFIHWGLYSVPAFGREGYPREMYRVGSAINEHHVARYGPLTSFGYKDSIPPTYAYRISVSQ